MQRTPEENRQAVEEYLATLPPGKKASPAELGESLGISRERARQLLRTYAPPGTPKERRGERLRRESNERLAPFLSGDFSVDDIVKQTGMHPASVRRWLKARGITPQSSVRESRATPRNERMKQYVGSDKTVQEIAEAEGVSPATVSNGLRANGEHRGKGGPGRRKRNSNT